MAKAKPRLCVAEKETISRATAKSGVVAQTPALTEISSQKGVVAQCNTETKMVVRDMVATTRTNASLRLTHHIIATCDMSDFHIDGKKPRAYSIAGNTQRVVNGYLTTEHDTRRMATERNLRVER